MRKGFTLLELLIVVVILGILALIAAPMLLNAADQAKNGAVKANISAAASSITSEFAINTADTAADIAADVVAKLNANTPNPITGVANNAFVAGAAGGAGQVALQAGLSAADAHGIQYATITLRGYDKGGALIATKVIAAPGQ